MQKIRGSDLPGDKLCHQAFGEFKSKLSSPFVLKFTELNKSFEVHIGVSEFAIGGLSRRSLWEVKRASGFS
jgi:hypothetical protein